MVCYYARQPLNEQQFSKGRHFNNLTLLQPQVHRFNSKKSQRLISPPRRWPCVAGAMLIYQQQPHHSLGGAAAAATAQLVPARFLRIKKLSTFISELSFNQTDIILLNPADPLTERHRSHGVEASVLLKRRAGQGSRPSPYLMNRLSRLLGSRRDSFFGIVTTLYFHWSPEMAKRFGSPES